MKKSIACRRFLRRKPVGEKAILVKTRGRADARRPCDDGGRKDGACAASSGMKLRRRKDNLNPKGGLGGCTEVLQVMVG